MFHTQSLKRAFRTLRHVPVLNRLLPSLVRRWHLWTGQRYRVSRVQDALWLLDVQEHSGRRMATWGDFEAAQFEYLRAQMARLEAQVFLDIGAFAGYYSIRLAQWAPSLEVHAFEPHPQNRAQLWANLYLNDLVGRVHVHPEALGAEHGEGQIRYSSLRNRGNAGLTLEGEGLAMSHPVAVVPLDSVLDCEGLRIAMKIDTEGYEGQVLQGMRHLLSRNQCVMQIECWDQNQAAFRERLRGLDLKVEHQIFWDFYVRNF